MNFEQLLQTCARAAYPEPRSPIHDQIGQIAVEHICGVLNPGAEVLDVGCGSAFCSVMFQQRGHKPLAISVLQSEVDAAKKLGVEAELCEMHDLPTLHRSFDLVWLRHVAEHSPAPLFLLHLCHEATRPGGLLYLEVPMPWTSAVHESNPDHFSVLNAIAWGNLLRRAGWSVLNEHSWPLLLECGPDSYHSFICRRA